MPAVKQMTFSRPTAKDMFDFWIHSHFLPDKHLGAVFGVSEFATRRRIRQEVAKLGIVVTDEDGYCIPPKALYRQARRHLGIIQSTKWLDPIGYNRAGGG